METDNSIYFYSSNNDFSYMSNFYRTNFTDTDGITYNCTEQYFMYHKCLTFEPENKALVKEILTETNPTKIKSLGRKVKNYDEQVWNEKRYEIMLNALYLKFTQNQTILQKLLSTGQKTLYEASKYDKIWGIGYSIEDISKINVNVNVDPSKYGSNLLGKALMEIREKIALGKN